MFRHVPACFGMFGVPGFIDGHFDTEMSNKCLVLIISVAFVGVTLYTLLIASPRRREEKRREEKKSVQEIRHEETIGSRPWIYQRLLSPRGCNAT